MKVGTALEGTVRVFSGAVTFGLKSFTNKELNHKLLEKNISGRGVRSIKGLRGGQD